MEKEEKEALEQQLAELDQEHTDWESKQEEPTGTTEEVRNEIAKRTIVTSQYLKKRENLRRLLIGTERVSSGVQDYLNPNSKLTGKTF